MSDIETTQAEAPAETNGEVPVDPSAIISRGKGLSLDAAEQVPEKKAVLDQFRDVVGRHREAQEAEAELLAERNALVVTLKDEHDVGFSAIAEILGNTSSLALYVYERAHGFSAKEIRERSKASAAAKAQARVDDPDRKPARKQTPEEKAFRKTQREALKAFLAEQRERAAQAGEDTEGYDAAGAELDAEAAADGDE